MSKQSLEDQLIAQELARLQRNDSTLSNVDEKAIYKALTADFPKDAYSKDNSRGFALTSIKAQYVIERLNEVLGFMNWSHGGEYEVLEEGVLFKGALVVSINGKQNRFFAVGYSQDKKNLGDAYKAAKTDSLSKCASQIGVGNDTFKGLIDPITFTKKTTEVVSVNVETNAPEEKPSSFKTRTKRSRPALIINDSNKNVFVGDDI